MTYDYKKIQIQETIEIAYIDEGSNKKPVLLFIHGLANYLQVWYWNIEYLKNNFRCIAIDLPGNGLSSRGKYEYSIQFYSNVINEFIAKLKLEQVTIVGHSMGGQIAIKASLDNPTAISKLVLCAPSGFEYYSSHEVMMCKTAMQFGQFMNMDEAHLSQSIQSSFFEKSMIASKMIQELTKLIQENDRNLYRTMLDKSMTAMLDEPIFYQLKNVTQACLVFFGERDELIPNRFFHPKSTKEIAEKACNEISKARLILFPKTGHFVQIERAHEVNLEIEVFLKM